MHPNQGWPTHQAGARPHRASHMRRRGRAWAQAPHTQRAHAPRRYPAHMPSRAGSALPLRVAPIAPIVTVPEWLNLSVPREPRDSRAVRRALQGFLASARIEADGGPADAPQREGAPTAPCASTQAPKAQGQRASTHTPPVRKHTRQPRNCVTPRSMNPTRPWRLRFPPSPPRSVGRERARPCRWYTTALPDKRAQSDPTRAPGPSRRRFPSPVPLTASATRRCEDGCLRGSTSTSHDFRPSLPFRLITLII